MKQENPGIVITRSGKRVYIDIEKTEAEEAVEREYLRRKKSGPQILQPDT